MKLFAAKSRPIRRVVQHHVHVPHTGSQQLLINIAVGKMHTVEAPPLSSVQIQVSKIECIECWHMLSVAWLHVRHKKST